MNFKHAVGFLMVGTMFGLLPRFFPAWCSGGMGGANTRELWLQVMSFVQVGLAGGFFLGRASSAIASMLEYLPSTVAIDADSPDAVDAEDTFEIPEPIHVMPVRRPALPSRLGARAMIPLPVSLEATLLEPRQAA